MTYLPGRANLSGSAPEPLHVLTLTPFYPHADDGANGCFVAEPLVQTKRYDISQTVMAVRPWHHRSAKSTAAFPARWKRFFSLPRGFGLPSGGAFLFASLIAEIRRLHAERPIGLIHAHSALPCGHAAALAGRELGIPFVVSVHGLDAYSTRQVGGIAGQWCERVSRMVYRSAKAVICVSEKVQEQVLERANGRIETLVVYNGVDTDRFAPGKNVAEGAGILSIGNLIPIKGHEQLLRAFAEVAGKFPEVSCTLIGEGAERDRLAAIAADLKLEGKLRLLGRQSRQQIADAMKGCMVFVLPSRYEGLGCVYLEAMATGRPVIACLGQGIGEVIQNGLSGLLVPPDDLAELSDALRRLLMSSELRRFLGENARRRILEGFRLEDQASRLAEVYRESIR